MGAVIIKGNRVLATGYNQIRHLKRGSKYTEYDCSLHAERDACSKLDKTELKGTTIVVFRKTKDGNPAEAMPCDQCMWMIKELGIKRIISSCALPALYKVTKL
jgi:deoxycytidylate deaminase